ncbi:DUF6479 family protein [Streptomyces viridosporus]|uniref:Secreted protein n=1 Tax=Streptomyces viridosporus T7A TaxID=665577 RepID=A0ABX6AA99_STRVD|nr:DUF6479 family protein [Streptomyces viridosporus]QEU84271.1 hypothetical protein CP969_05910 [Streptomyces viridosporus T7A]
MTNTSWMQSADLAASRGALGIGLVVAAVVVVALLIGAFALGSRRVARSGIRRPRPEEQPRVPEGGPVREVREHREPDEVPRSDTRLTPHELNDHGNSGTRTGAPQQRPRWDEGSSGGFGSGGPGGR